MFCPRRRVRQQLSSLATPFLGILLVAAASSAAFGQMPARVSDQEFWRFVSEFSEPGGFFRSENFVGNETSLQHAIPELTKRVKPGGVYMGVAPDQNFTFIVALRPSMAFIVDIRRQNLIQHLLYKALFELSPTRSDFLARLFARERVASVPTDAPVNELLDAYYLSRPSSALFERNLATVRDHLVKTRGFALTPQDTVTLRHVYESFFNAGPFITYNYPNGGGGGRGMPTYADMVSETDASGARRSYLASEANYRIIREFQQNNLLVPIVGDFAGQKALRTVGQYVRDRGAHVTAFYTSNVEQYLFQGTDEWYRFYTNVATLPLDSSSTLIRSVPNNNAYMAGAAGWPGPRSTMLLSYMSEIVGAFKAGRIVGYTDVIKIAR